MAIRTCGHAVRAACECFDVQTLPVEHREAVWAVRQVEGALPLACRQLRCCEKVIMVTMGEGSDALEMTDEKEVRWV